MYIIESLISALHNLKSNKLRSFLTMLGIIIGISSVITIVSIGLGGQKYIIGQFDSLQTNILNLSVSSTKSDINHSDYFTLNDTKIVKEKVPKVIAVVPTEGGRGTVKFAGNLKQVDITATTADITSIVTYELITGRLLRERDIDVMANVVVIDDSAAVQLFRTTENAVGKVVSLTTNGITNSLTVVGVIKNPAGNIGMRFRNNMPGTAIVPISLDVKMFTNPMISRMTAVLTDMNTSDEVSAQIVRTLEAIHHTSNKYAAEQGFKQLDTLNNVLGMLTLVVGAIAGISLLVGGIGVMNIMLVSVTERTREIGIRKALGATMTDIRIQFLAESVILCAVGGTIGMLFGIGIGYFGAKALNITAVISVGIVILAFVFSSVVGIFFGLYPANKAAKLDPIEALRYE